MRSRVGDAFSRRSMLRAGAAGLVAGVAGCQGGSSGEAIDDSEPLVTHERFGRGATALTYQTSTFYTPVEDESDQPAAAPALRAQHEEWAENHPEYRIEVSYPAFGQWKDDLLTRASEGGLPDGSTLDSFWVPEFYEHLEPLNDHVDDIDDFFPFVRETAMRDGDLLAAWKYTGCRCLYYRQDLLDRYNDGDPPETWEELIAVGGDIADNEELTAFMFTPSALANLPHFWAQGGELVDEEGAPVLDDDPNRSALVDALAFIRELVESGVTPQRTANVSAVEDLPREGRNDQLAMFIGNNDQIERNLKNVVEEDDSIPDDQWERWQVAKIPRPADGSHATGVGGWTDATFIGSDAPDADVDAMKSFIGKFVEPASMGRYCESAALLPTRESLYEDDDLFASDTFVYQDRFREFLQDGVARPAFPIYPTIADEYETAIERVITDQATPTEAAESMIQNVNETYSAP